MLPIFFFQVTAAFAWRMIWYLEYFKQNWPQII